MSNIAIAAVEELCSLERREKSERRGRNIIGKENHKCDCYSIKIKYKM